MISHIFIFFKFYISEIKKRCNKKNVETESKSLNPNF